MKYIYLWWNNPFLKLFTIGVMLFTILSVIPRQQYGFWIAMLWNLFLVIIPVVLAFISLHSQKIIRVLSWILSLVFLPNTWYVLTDIRHLIWLHPKPDGITTIVRSGWDMLAGGNVWMSEIMLFLLALLGLAAGGYAGYVLVKILCQQAEGVKKKIYTHIGFITIAYMSGFAIYIGRYIRLNSWDIITRPLNVAGEFITAHQDPQMIFVTLLFGAIAYITMIIAQYLYSLK